MIISCLRTFIFFVSLISRIFTEILCENMGHSLSKNVPCCQYVIINAGGFPDFYHKCLGNNEEDLLTRWPQSGVTLYIRNVGHFQTLVGRGFSTWPQAIKIRKKLTVIRRDISVWATLQTVPSQNNTPTHALIVKFLVAIFVYSSHRKDSIVVLNIAEQNISQLVLISLVISGSEANHLQF